MGYGLLTSTLGLLFTLLLFERQKLKNSFIFQPSEPYIQNSVK